MAKKIIGFKDYLEREQRRRARRKPKNESLPVLDQVFISSDGRKYETLNEARNWVDGRFNRNVGIDQPIQLGVLAHPLMPS